MSVDANEIVCENAMGRECKSRSGKPGNSAGVNQHSTRNSRGKIKVGRIIKILIKPNVNNQSNIFEHSLCNNTVCTLLPLIFTRIQCSVDY